MAYVSQRRPSFYDTMKVSMAALARGGLTTG